MDGRLIRSIAVRGATGDNRILWDGCNQQGMQVANGPYLYQVEVGDSQGVRRVSGKVARLR
jgi:flagellar hook assembly protein FlgD